MTNSNEAKCYLVSEDDIVKISQLIGIFEDTIKKVIRKSHSQALDNFCEDCFCEMSSRICTDQDDDLKQTPLF